MNEKTYKLSHSDANIWVSWWYNPLYIPTQRGLIPIHTDIYKEEDIHIHIERKSTSELSFLLNCCIKNGSYTHRVPWYTANIGYTTGVLGGTFTPLGDEKQNIYIPDIPVTWYCSGLTQSCTKLPYVLHTHFQMHGVSYAKLPYEFGL